ncbi:MAG: DUF222 domain-containing protein [Actinobacteria bacterium]|nr:DUF222 domain-containing protein [Actinomycetota bacterium]
MSVVELPGVVEVNATERIEAEISAVCGIVNAATGRLVRLIAEALATGAWKGDGIRSPAHWVAWRCGVSNAHADELVAMARRVDELPATVAALEAGELSEDQARVVRRHAPARIDAEVVDLARHATVSQLTRALSSYRFDEPAPDPVSVEAGETDPPMLRRRAWWGFTDDGRWRLSADLPADEGAGVDRALAAAITALHDQADADGADGGADCNRRVGRADALVRLAEGAMAAELAQRPHRDRHLTIVHIDAHPDANRPGHLHAGPVLPDALRRLLTCDGRIRAVIEIDGRPLKLGRTERIVPDRLRLLVENRDRGCVVPGCAATTHLVVHHIVHWEHGGVTETHNLVCLCPRHHRTHHAGLLGITGDADHPRGLTFTDRRGRPLRAGPTPRPPTPRPPTQPLTNMTGIPTPAYRGPTGERLDTKRIWFDTS